MNLSVVITTYNRRDLVTRAIDSVLSQSLSPDEIIVVDDGSDDDTIEVLKRYASDIKVVRQKNRGVSSARNRGVMQAKGDWIAFLDSDDLWSGKKLKTQTLFHKTNPSYRFSHTNEIWIRDEKTIKQKRRHQKPHGRCFYENLDFCRISPSTVMIKRDLFEETGGFDEELVVCEDYDLWLRILKKEPVALIKESLTYKYAGEWKQLSFSKYFKDIYHIKALMKHMPDPHIESTIIKKLLILQKGAKKHNNDIVLSFCRRISDELELGLV